MKARYTAIMLAVLVALGAYVFFFERSPMEPKSKNQEPKVSILSAQADEISKIELKTPLASKPVSFEKVKGKWRVGGKEADQDKIVSIVRELSPWQASRSLEDKFDTRKAADFGLKPAKLEVKVTHAGQSDTLEVGNKTPTNSGYYITRQGDPKLYLSFINVPDDLLRLAKDPPLKPKPSPTPQASASAKAMPKASASPA